MLHNFLVYITLLMRHSNSILIKKTEFTLLFELLNNAWVSSSINLSNWVILYSPEWMRCDTKLAWPHFELLQNRNFVLEKSGKICWPEWLECDGRPSLRSSPQFWNCLQRPEQVSFSSLLSANKKIFLKYMRYILHYYHNNFHNSGIWTQT